MPSSKPRSVHRSIAASHETLAGLARTLLHEARTSRPPARCRCPPRRGARSRDRRAMPRALLEPRQTGNRIIVRELDTAAVRRFACPRPVWLSATGADAAGSGRMAIAITDAHRELADVARAFLEKRTRRAPRRVRCWRRPTRRCPPFWGEMAELGWLGLHLPEEYGGSGLRAPRARRGARGARARSIAPGPFLPTVIASALIDRSRRRRRNARALPPGAGRRLAGRARSGSQARRPSPRTVMVSGDAGLVPRRRARTAPPDAGR